MAFVTFGVLYVGLSIQIRAAITLIDHKIANDATSSSTVTVSGLTSSNSGESFFIAFLGNGTTDTSSCTDNGSSHATYTATTGAKSTNGALWTDVWEASNIPSGITSITCTVGGSGTRYKTMEVWHASGMATSSPRDTAGIVNATSSCSTTCNGPSLTTTNANDLIVAIQGAVSGSCTSTSANPKAGNEFTAGGDLDTAGSSGAAASAIVSATGSHQYVWTYNAACVGEGSSAAYKMAAVASGTNPQSLTLLGAGPGQ